MSTFAVTIETIAEIRPHTNADRLEMASLVGKDYEFVVAKGEFRHGNRVVYFPIDSVLPQAITDALGVTGKLAGKDKNRVKTIKLRGNISQGIVAAPETLVAQFPAVASAQAGADLTALLGVEKYEPPVVASQYGDLLPLPELVSKYDIESAQNHVTVVERLLDQPVYITEKLEGSHWSVTWMAEDDRMVVSQRNFRIEPVDGKEHDWHKVARLGNYADKLRQIAAEWEAEHDQLVQAVTLRGEMVGPGVQGNYYKLTDHAAYIFEAEINAVPLAAPDFLQLATRYDLLTVPILAHDVTLRKWLDGKTLKEASDGRSLIADKAREGVVIKPLVEQRDDALGRLVIKQRSPAYLAKSDF